MKLERIPIGRINPAPYNPRVALAPGDPEYEALARSIDEFGLVEPLVWNRRTGNLVGGHQRLAVLKARGERHAQVSAVDLSIEQEKALNLALNKIAGRWDEGKLAALLGELTQTPEFDITLTGFDPAEVTELLARAMHQDVGNDEEFDVDAALDTKGPAVTKPGALVVLGQHRLVCGDCTDPAVVRRLMDGERAVLFATDPPYCVGYDGTNHPGPNAARRNKDWSGTYAVTWDDKDANPELYDKFIAAALKEAITPNAAWYCWHASRRQAMVEGAWEKHGAFVHCQIIWAKNRPILTRSWYTWQHEPCFFGWVKGKKPPRAADNVRSTLWTIDTIPNGAQRPDHPTPKPLAVFEIPMRQHTKAGEICYEPFAGSGTQLIAAQRLRRRCFALEISPHYCDVIVRRWIHLVGEANAPKALVKLYRKPAGNNA